MKKFKKLTEKRKSDLEVRIKRLLFAGLDYCANTKQEQNMWFSPNNPYCAEAFGILHCLDVLGFGYFGADNVDSDGNLKFWFNKLNDEVKEDGLKYGAKESYHRYIDLNK